MRAALAEKKSLRAIISVSDKTGIVDFARELVALGVEIISTGGTARALNEGGVTTTAVSAYTSAPEILGGRVKTLHPRVHGGILARDTGPHKAELTENNIDYIDFVVVNLYPFSKTVAKPNVDFQEAIENIDIGGPTLLRAAAKNHERVTAVVDPADYSKVVSELKANKKTSKELRLLLAKKVFAHTAAYDSAISAYLTSRPAEGEASVSVLPSTLNVQFEKLSDLRYGENPHQEAAFYREAWPFETGAPRVVMADAEVLQGKALSYNNIIDIDAALACCLEFENPTVVVVKHTNPCGVASHNSLAEAYKLARQTDPTSSFGGIVAANREIPEDLAGQLVETFLECVIAPGFSPEALQILSRKKNLRLLSFPQTNLKANSSKAKTRFVMRSVAGGMLVQSGDDKIIGANEAKVVSKRQPTAEELEGLHFAWRVGKHVKSNAIVYCRGARTLGVGAGQMSRVDSAAIAKMKANESLDGACVASDAFFPFRDGLDVLAEAGATAVIQPGGSIRDNEVIEAANEHGMAMLFTGMRHFRH